MSARNHYDAGLGVLPIRWIHGAAPDGTWGLVLCEVWRAQTEIAYSEANKPRVVVEADLETRLFVGGAWMRLLNNGSMSAVTPGEVRRHARLLRSRSWHATITLDGWDS